jgi:hypothetical protein
MPRSLPFSKCSSTCQSFANGLDHFWQGGSLWGKDKVVRFLGWISEATANEQPMSCIIFPTFATWGRLPRAPEPGARACLRSSTAAANLDQRASTLRPMQLLLVCDRWVPGIRPVHVPRHSHHIGIPMHFVPSYAGSDCHRKPYQLRRRQMGI